MNVRLLMLATLVAGPLFHQVQCFGLTAPVLVRTSGTLPISVMPGKYPDEPEVCGIAGGASTWFKYVPASNGTLFAKTDGSNFDTLLGVFVDNGSNQGFSSLIQIACDDNSGANGLSSSLRASVTNGQPCYIMLDGKNGAHGMAVLSYSFDQAPLISKIAQQTVREDQSIVVPFVISDKETAACHLQVFGEGVDTNLLPSSAFVFGGTGTNRSARITPSAGHFGTNAVCIAVCDSVGNVSCSWFNLNVKKVNHKPVAGDINYTRLPNHAISISISALMQNASDIDHDKVTLISVSPRSRANASVTKGATFVTYTAPNSYNSEDRFTYTITDGNGATAMGTVKINVSPSTGKTVVY